MKIGLIDVDGSNFPNLCLMKLSSYHKRRLDDVEWYDAFEHYDKVYCSKVFSFTPDYQHPINADEVIKGGTGYAIHGAGGETYLKRDDPPLPTEIEHTAPDYTLYANRYPDTAFGFLTRGCPRGCDFCIVGKKEGMCSVATADLSEFWNGEKNITLLDPNILACRECEQLLEQLIDSKAYIDFNQGLDARLLTEERCKMLARIKMREVHFAWDRYEDKEKILPKLELYAKYNGKMGSHKRIVYVLVNHGTSIQQDLERVYTLRDMGYWAYIMVYDKGNASKEIRRLQRWCNNRIIFSQCPKFEDFEKIKEENENQLSLW